MRLLDLTLATPQENLALDDALLEDAEDAVAHHGPAVEVLRLWEPAEPLVVIGRSSKIQEEVNLDFCRQQGIPVLRRCSGGAAVVAGPGCLMYSLVLCYGLHPGIRMINATHDYVMSLHAEALGALVEVDRAGISDLAFGPQRRKFSGNSLRCKRNCLLYHGTFLHHFDLPLIGQCLDDAPRQPEYRQGRGHLDFVANLEVDPAQLRRLLAKAWHAEPVEADWPRSRTQELAVNRYHTPEWNERL